MKFFLDTAEINEIEELNQLGIVDGVTTNPSLILKSGKKIIDVITNISNLIDGPVSAEVVSSESTGMIAEGLELLKIGENITIKVPLTWEGLKACRELTNKGAMVNVTLCFSLNQAILAAKAGATFISPFVGRLDDINLEGMGLIADIRQAYDNYNFQTEILAASIRSVNHVSEAALVGADIVTVPPKIIRALVEHPLTTSGLDTFNNDWKKTGQDIL